MVYQLIYISSVAPGINDQALASLAKKACASNERLDVTGVMLVHNGSIMQVLEGNELVVESLYKKISYDKRHTQCLVMIRRDAPEREFKDWRMGFKYIENGTNEAAVFKLTKDALQNMIPANASDELQSIGRSYARVSGL